VAQAEELVRTTVDLVLEGLATHQALHRHKAITAVVVFGIAQAEI
jgi:hypothetical protein